MYKYTHTDNYWEWRFNGDEDTYFCTNKEGEGVFMVDLCRNSREQLTGTCQFSVRGLSEKYARHKIREFMRDTWYERRYTDAIQMKNKMNGTDHAE